jgi:hypothetical protein
LFSIFLFYLLGCEVFFLSVVWVVFTLLFFKGDFCGLRSVILTVLEVSWLTEMSWVILVFSESICPIILE